MYIYIADLQHSEHKLHLIVILLLDTYICMEDKKMGWGSEQACFLINRGCQMRILVKAKMLIVDIIYPTNSSDEREITGPSI